MNLDSRVKIPNRVFAQSIDDEMVILDTITQNYFGLDAMGRVMWETIEKRELIRDILDTLLDIYDVKEDKLHKDLYTFIDTLVDSQLLEVD